MINVENLNTESKKEEKSHLDSQYSRIKFLYYVYACLSSILYAFGKQDSL